MEGTAYPTWGPDTLGSEVQGNSWPQGQLSEGTTCPLTPCPTTMAVDAPFKREQPRRQECWIITCTLTYTPKTLDVESLNPNTKPPTGPDGTIKITSYAPDFVNLVCTIDLTKMEGKVLVMFMVFV